jgi:hypothetical protein
MRDYFKESGLLVDKKNDAVLKVGKVLTWKEAGAIFQQADANTIKNLQNQEQQQRIATSRAEQAVHEYQLQKLKKEEGESALAFSERQEGHDAMVHLGSLMDKLKKEKKPSGIVDAWDGLTGKEKVLMHPVIEKELSGVREDLAKLGKEDTVLNPWSPDQKQLHADLIKREERLLQADGGVQQAMSNDVQKQALVKASADKIAQARNVIDRLGRGKPSQVAMFDPDHPEKAFWADPGYVAGLKELGIIELPPMTAAEKQAHADQEAAGREMAIETVAPGVAAVGRGLSRAVRGIQSLQGSSRNQ